MKKSYIFVTLLSLLLISCAHQVDSTSAQQSRSLFQAIDFSSPAEALSYAMERRLQIQRMYENSSEPYFGKPEEVKCKNNIDIEGVLRSVRGGSMFFLNILVNDHHAIGDCLLEHNTQRAVYEFLICDKKVYEYRTFFKIQETLPLARLRNCISF